MEAESKRTVYGTQIEPSQWNQLRSVVGEVANAPAGNVVLRVGSEVEPGGGWRQSEHVVMKPREALLFAMEVLARSADGADIQTTRELNQSGPDNPIRFRVARPDGAVLVWARTREHAEEIAAVR